MRVWSSTESCLHLHNLDAMREVTHGEARERFMVFPRAWGREVVVVAVGSGDTGEAQFKE